MNNYDTVNLICAIIAGGAWVVAFLKHLAYTKMESESEAWEETAKVWEAKAKDLETKLRAKFEQELKDLSKPKFEPKTIKLSEAGLARLEADMERKQGIRKDMQEKKLTVEEIEAKWGVTFLKELPHGKEAGHEHM